jgi:hypothetical protein
VPPILILTVNRMCKEHVEFELAISSIHLLRRSCALRKRDGAMDLRTGEIENGCRINQRVRSQSLQVIDLFCEKHEIDKTKKRVRAIV